MLHHGHPGSQNFVSWIAIDSSGWVYQGSVFSYILALALAPTGANARAAYMRAVALVVAQLQLYAKAVADFNQEMLMTFEAFSNYTFPLYRLHVEPEEAQNLGKMEVL